MVKSLSKKVIFFISLFFCFFNVNSNNIFIPSYNGVPDSVKYTIDEVFTEWEKYIYTEIPIHIEINWSVLSNNPASAQPASYFSNLNHKMIKDVLYPKPLAEKLLNKELGNENDPDIVLFINKNYSWYLGVDGIVPDGKFDLFTFLFHEIAHGLGINGSFVQNINLKQLILDSDAIYPSIYDYYVGLNDSITLQKKYMILSSDSLYNIVTSNNLYWQGKYASLLNNNEKPKLYAPSSFNTGSSIYHLDETLYSLDDTNSLITPKFSNTGEEVIHYPGPILLGMLADLGWTDYFFYHTPIRNIENIDSVVSISVVVPELFNDSVFIYYSFDNFKNIQISEMSKSNLNKYTAQIPSYPFERTLKFYFKGYNGEESYSSPHNSPNSSYSIFFGEDTLLPTIFHTRFYLINEDQQSIIFTSKVIDDITVDSVYIVYSYKDLIDTLWPAISEMNVYEIELDLSSLSIELGFDFKYQIFAVDGSNGANKTSTEKYIVSIGSNSSALNFYKTDFNNLDIADFSLEGFDIKIESGFSNGALHSIHPYESPMIDQTSINYTATIKMPFKISNTNAIMAFDEVVLVEPGEIGTIFGQFGFWDYVIVEGSHDKQNWYAFEKTGYDSGDEISWLTRYYSNIVDENSHSSVALGDETLYRTKTINLLSNKFIKRGDVVYIRFRLFSDAFTSAWGWAIDNLEIQKEEITSTNELDNENIVFPNPCNETLFVKAQFKDLMYVVYTQTGSRVQTGTINDNKINVSKLMPGIYLINIISDIDIHFTKFIKQ